MPPRGPLGTILCITAGLLPCALLAQPKSPDAPYPVRPIRLIIPYSPGGASDNIARVVMPRVSTALGQSIVIDNRPGGAGILGRELAVRAAPDGIPFEEGVRYDDCRIDLPGIGPITVSIEMRYAIEIARPNGKNVRRSGFAFVRLRPESSHRIQRYMMQLQRARIAVR